jgi:hypothetical protein
MTKPIRIADVALDAATEAYVRQRWLYVKEWRERFPDVWNDTRIRIKAALIAYETVKEAEEEAEEPGTKYMPSENDKGD